MTVFFVLQIHNISQGISGVLQFVSSQISFDVVSKNILNNGFFYFYVLWFDTSKKLDYFSSFKFVIQLSIVSVFWGNGSLNVAKINEQHVGKPDQIGDCGVGCNWN